jgi:hypothetical protein
MVLIVKLGLVLVAVIKTSPIIGSPITPPLMAKRKTERWIMTEGDMGLLDGVLSKLVVAREKTKTCPNAIKRTPMNAAKLKTLYIVATRDAKISRMIRDTRISPGRLPPAAYVTGARKIMARRRRVNKVRG